MSNINIGDVFAFELENSMFGACRIIRSDAKGKSFLVACCRWISEDVPDNFSVVDFRDVLLLEHNNWKSEPLVCWVPFPLPNSFIKLGVCPIFDEDLSSSDLTVRWENFPIQRFNQWEWENVT